MLQQSTCTFANIESMIDSSPSTTDSHSAVKQKASAAAAANARTSSAMFVDHFLQQRAAAAAAAAYMLQNTSSPMPSQPAKSDLFGSAKLAMLSKDGHEHAFTNGGSEKLVDPRAPPKVSTATATGKLFVSDSVVQ